MGGGPNAGHFVIDHLIAVHLSIVLARIMFAADRPPSTTDYTVASPWRQDHPRGAAALMRGLNAANPRVETLQL